MTFDPTKWFCSEQILLPKGAPETAVFLNTATGEGVTYPNVERGATYAQGQWTRVDLTGLIPSDAVGVYLHGLLIITHGTDQETANLRLNLKPPSSTENAANYEGQVIEVWVGGGQRTNYSAWVGVENCQFDFWWEGKTGSYPTKSALGVNLTIQAIAR